MKHPEALQVRRFQWQTCRCPDFQWRSETALWTETILSELIFHPAASCGTTCHPPNDHSRSQTAGWAERRWLPAGRWTQLDSTHAADPSMCIRQSASGSCQWLEYEFRRCPITQVAPLWTI